MMDLLNLQLYMHNHVQEKNKNLPFSIRRGLKTQHNTKLFFDFLESFLCFNLP